MIIQSRCLRAIFVIGSMALAIVQGFDAHARGADCVLYVDDGAREDAAAWNALGFKLETRKGIEGLPLAERAKMLDDTHYALIRHPGKDVMWLSTARGAFSKGWVPAEVAAPAIGIKPDGRYACASLRSHLPYFNESRRAVVDVMALAMNLRIGRTVGEAILDLERYWLVPHGYPKYEKTSAKAKYLEMLGKVKDLQENYGDDFRVFWLAVRQLVYSKDQTYVKYCDDYAAMTTALVDHCTSCVGESYLMVALFLDSHPKLPKGFEFGVQTFTNHIRPVIYNLDTKRTLDLVSGGAGPFRSAILKPNVIFRALFLGGTSMRLDEEKARVAALPIEFVYRDWACIFKNTPIGRHKLQPAEFEGTAGCKPFEDGDGTDPNPHRADNQNKTDMVSYDETKSRKGQKGAGGSENSEDGDSNNKTAGDEKGKSGPSSKGAIENKSGKDGPRPFISMVGSFFGSSDGGGVAFTDSYRPAFEYIRANLSPDDRALVEADLKRGWASQKLLDLTSEQGLIDATGFGYRVPAEHPTWTIAPLINPILASETPVEDGSIAMLSSERERDTRIDRVRDWVLDVTSTDKRLIQELKKASIPERPRILIRILGRNLGASVESFNRMNWPAGTATSDLSRASEDQQLKKILVDLSDRTTEATNLISALRGQTYATPSGEPNDPFSDSVKFLIIKESRASQIIDPIQKAFVQMENGPVELVREASRDEGRGAQLLGSRGIVTSVGRIQMNLRQLFPRERQFKRWSNFSAYEEQLNNSILFRLLTHPDFFFTVEPERDEVVTQRPVYPLQILDPRVLELLRRSESAANVRINLPTWTGIQCPPGAKGFFGAGVVVECGRGSEAPIANEFQNLKNQDGVVGGSADGINQGNPEGRDVRSQHGFITQKTEGQDQAAGRVLQTRLSPEDQRLRTSPSALEITRGGDDAGDSSVMIDPRREIHLPPYVWHHLFAGAASSMLSEPSVQILSHHVYRRRLAPVYDSPDLGTALRAIDFIAFTRPDVVLAEQKCRTRDCKWTGPEVANEDRSALLDQALVDLQVYDPSEGQSGQAFYKIAVHELERPKPGFIVITPGALSSAPEALAAIQTARERGGSIGTRVSMKGLEFDTLGDASSKGALVVEVPRIGPFLTFRNRSRAPIWNTAGQMIGIRTVRGSNFGHVYYVYHSLASDPTASDRMRAERAMEEGKRATEWEELKPTRGIVAFKPK